MVNEAKNPSGEPNESPSPALETGTQWVRIAELPNDVYEMFGPDSCGLAAECTEERYAILIVNALNRDHAFTALVEALGHCLKTKHDVRTCACVGCEDARVTLALAQPAERNE